MTREEIYQVFLETEIYTATADTNEPASLAQIVLDSNSHRNWYIYIAHVHHWLTDTSSKLCVSSLAWNNPLPKQSLHMEYNRSQDQPSAWEEHQVKGKAQTVIQHPKWAMKSISSIPDKKVNKYPKPRRKEFAWSFPNFWEHEVQFKPVLRIKPGPLFFFFYRPFQTSLVFCHIN